MLAHMGSQFIILIFLEGCVIKGLCRLRHLVLERCQQFLDEGRVVENAMYVGSHAVGIHEVAIFCTIVQMQKG